LDITEDEIRSNFRTTIKELNGEQNFDVIDNYEFKKFPDETIDISIGFNYYNSKRDLRIEIWIYFSKEDVCSIIDIKITAENSREKSKGISDNLERIISQNKNLNFIFHPSVPLAVIMSVIGIFTPSLTIFLFKYNKKISVGILILGILIGAYFWLFNRWKPYCTFDTNIQSRNNKIANYFLLGMMTFIIFSTGLFFLRKWLIGQ
jgi:hypothetical protein